MVNTEARTLHSSSYSRKVVIARLGDLTQGQFSEIVQQNAAGLLVLLPLNLSTIAPDKQKVSYIPGPLTNSYGLGGPTVSSPTVSGHCSAIRSSVWQKIQKACRNGHFFVLAIRQVSSGEELAYALNLDDTWPRVFKISY